MYLLDTVVFLQSELLYRPGQLAAMGPIGTSSTLDRHSLSTRSTSLRRMRNLLELEAKHLGATSSRTPDPLQLDRARVLEINPAGRYFL